MNRESASQGNGKCGCVRTILDKRPHSDKVSFFGAIMAANTPICGAACFCRRKHSELAIKGRPWLDSLQSIPVFSNFPTPLWRILTTNVYQKWKHHFQNKAVRLQETHPEPDSVPEAGVPGPGAWWTRSSQGPASVSPGDNLKSQQVSMES